VAEALATFHVEVVLVEFDGVARARIVDDQARQFMGSDHAQGLDPAA
jgi:hypothetical protein